MLRDNQGRARAARVVFLLLSAASVLVLAMALLLPSQAKVAMTHQMALLYIGFSLTVALHIGLIIVGYVTLIMWLRRAYYNLHQLPGVHPEYSDGWAAGAWFVPFINFVRPFTITREVWNDTQQSAYGRVAEPATVLGWWWAAWVLKLIVGRITWAMSKSSDEGLTDNTLLAAALDAGSELLVAILTWYVIGRMARFEEQLALRQQVDHLGQAAPEVPAALLSEQLGYGQAEGY